MRLFLIFWFLLSTQSAVYWFIKLNQNSDSWLYLIMFLSALLWMSFALNWAIEAVTNSPTKGKGTKNDLL